MGIKESFKNPDQATAEDKAEVTKPTDAKRHLAAQVSPQSNNMTTKDASMETTHKIILQLQGELNTLREKQAGQSTNNTNPSGNNKGNWWKSKY